MSAFWYRAYRVAAVLATALDGVEHWLFTRHVAAEKHKRTSGHIGGSAT